MTRIVLCNLRSLGERRVKRWPKENFFTPLRSAGALIVNEGPHMNPIAFLTIPLLLTSHAAFPGSPVSLRSVVWSEKSHDTGRKAHELYPTLAEVEVPPDGAVGSGFEAVSDLAS